MRRKAPTAISMLVLAFAFGACGGGDGGAGSKKATTSADGGDAAALVRVTNKYLKAYGDQDARAACQTRSAGDRRDLARIGGSCVRAYTLILRSSTVAKNRSAFGQAQARAAEVTVRGARARVPVFAPGDDKPELTLFAQREHGRWLLADVPDARTAAFMRGG